MTNEDQKINEMLEDLNICAHCGGTTHETFINDDEHDEVYSVTICDDCGAEEA